MCPEAEDLWQKPREKLGGTPPPYLHAISFTLVGSFALLIHVLVLGPSIDMIRWRTSLSNTWPAAGLRRFSRHGSNSAGSFTCALITLTIRAR